MNDHGGSRQSASAPVFDAMSEAQRHVLRPVARTFVSMAARYASFSSLTRYRLWPKAGAHHCFTLNCFTSPLAARAMMLRFFRFAVSCIRPARKFLHVRHRQHPFPRVLKELSLLLSSIARALNSGRDPPHRTGPVVLAHRCLPLLEAAGEPINSIPLAFRQAAGNPLARSASHPIWLRAPTLPFSTTVPSSCSAHWQRLPSEWPGVRRPG